MNLPIGTKANLLNQYGHSYATIIKIDTDGTWQSEKNPNIKMYLTDRKVIEYDSIELIINELTDNK